MALEKGGDEIGKKEKVGMGDVNGGIREKEGKKERMNGMFP